MHRKNLNQRKYQPVLFESNKSKILIKKLEDCNSLLADVKDCTLVIAKEVKDNIPKRKTVMCRSLGWGTTILSQIACLMTINSINPKPNADAIGVLGGFLVVLFLLPGLLAEKIIKNSSGIKAYADLSENTKNELNNLFVKINSVAPQENNSIEEITRILVKAESDIIKLKMSLDIQKEEEYLQQYLRSYK